MIRVLLAEDQSMVRGALAALLSTWRTTSRSSAQVAQRR